MDTLNNGNTENKDLDTTERREKERRDNEQRTESDRRSGLESTKRDGVERRSAGDHSGKERRGHERRRRHSHRRWRKLKKTTVTLLVVMGICFFAALLLTYITGGLPNLVEKVVSKNIEKAIQRTTAEFAEGKFSPEALKGLGKNIDIEKLKGQAMRNLGGWEGDRGEKQSPDKYKGQEDSLKSMSRDDLEKKKDYYKDKYKEMLQR
ncbi:MAG: hypothetical protein Q7J76_08475 [Candidatus Brocadiaceae bacterium]|uniref:hypothetical protein n=1 Tax=Candidatus Wunengus sp. YC61 TaxID=3367698 RepID=UPI0027213A92|nr:hypothetical protein [Candidatus Brocadiaceae bacterium]